MKAFKYLLVFIIVFLISYLLLGLYEYGDQVHYRKFYNDIKGYNFLEAYVMGYFYLTSFEPISIFIVSSIIYAVLFKPLSNSAFIKQVSFYPRSADKVILFLRSLTLFSLFSSMLHYSFESLSQILSLVLENNGAVIFTFFNYFPSFSIFDFPVSCSKILYGPHMSR